MNVPSAFVPGIGIDGVLVLSMFSGSIAGTIGVSELEVHSALILPAAATLFLFSEV